MTDWCILRCAGSSTLTLARSLGDAGFECWTPTTLVQVQRARRAVKREDVPSPIMPTFVFAQADRMAELLAMSHAPSMMFQIWDAEQRRMVTKGHPHFRVFGNGTARPIMDRELHHLRLAERKQVQKTKARIFAEGDRVKLTEAGFEGLTGTVRNTRGQHTWVIFPGMPAPVQMPTWVLLSAIDDNTTVHIGSHKREQAQIAKAA